jgi:hypothetical protein
MLERNYDCESDCCGATMFHDSDICPKCKEHCEISECEEI